MANIKKYTAKDGSETWRVRYRLQRRSCSKTFADQRSAEAFGEMVDRWGPEQALTFIKEPTTPRRKGMTVAAAVERYVELRQGSTLRLYRTMARVHVNPVFGDKQMDAVTPEMVQRWVNGLDVSAATIRAAHLVLDGALTLAVNRGELASNPARKTSKTYPNGIRLPRKRAVREPVFLSKDEFALILKGTPKHYQPLVEFLAATGCRFGEALALTPADVNMRTGKVRFNKSLSQDESGHYEIGTTKTKASEREIAVPSRILEQLDLSKEYVFTTKYGTRMHQQRFRRDHWKTAKNNSGLPAHRLPRIHDLRHTHASWLLDAGISIPAIQKRLGHSDVMTTLRIYGHAAADSEDRILDVLT